MEENGKLVKFLYADREAVAEEKEDGNIIRFIRGYDLVASDSESARTYYHYASDEQGSITHVLGDDENGEYSLKNYYEYGAFGDFREQYEEAENRFGYNGEIFDPIGGQYYLRARYYNPVIGRFTQEDTYYGDGLNLYAYCRNLPVGYEDPSGHYPCKEKQDLYKKYREQGMTAQEANRRANYDLIKKNKGERAAKKYWQTEKKKTPKYYDDRNKLISAVRNKLKNDVLKRGIGKKKMLPALAGVIDMKTGKIYYGENDPNGNIPQKMHPIIQKRINEAKAIAYEKTSGAGSHAEVYALNEALLNRPGANLDDFIVYVVSTKKLGKKIPKAGIPMPRCLHCSYITDGVIFATPEVEFPWNNKY